MKKKDNQQLLGDIVRQLVDYYGLGSKLDEINIGHLWDENMGQMIAKHTNNIYLHEKTLVIELDSAALRNELAYGKERIRNMINEGLKKNLVEEVIVK
ncbi:MAG: DUF721 domain-containing protein [Bacteroidales bacterium]|nr:DUF721 domain-containing protein [Bacteroidales bacterium]